MANWVTMSVSSAYAALVQLINDKFLDLAKGNDPAKVTITDPPTDMIRWNSAAGRDEIYNGTTWVAKASTYAISISGNSGTTDRLTGIPIVQRNGVLQSSDAGKCIGITDDTCVVPNSVFSTGSIVRIYANSGSDRLVTGGSGVIFRRPGFSIVTSFHVQPIMWVELFFVAPNVAILTGEGFAA